MDIYEKKIIGGIVAGVVTPSALPLTASDFGDGDAAAYFKAATDIESEGIPIDAEILAQRSPESFYTVNDLKTMAVSGNSASVVYDATEKIKAGALKTFLLRQAADIVNSPDETAARLLDKLKLIINHADSHYATTENNFVLIRDLVDSTAAVLGDLHSGTSYAVPTGYTAIDHQLLDGFSRGDEHIIVGFTGSGKTALALNFAIRQAKANNFVGFVSREMSSTENMLRLLSSDSETPRWQIRKGLFNSTYDKLLDHLRGKFRDLPIAFDTRTSKVEDLRPLVRQMVEQYDMRILYVDYLQLMSSSSNKTSSSRATEVQTISRTLKEIAMENKIPVVSLCQFNRSAASASVYDIMGHLKESSAIEQDASTISYIQIEKPTTPPQRIRGAEMTILKNRNGSTFQAVQLDYVGETFTFTGGDLEQANKGY